MNKALELFGFSDELISLDREVMEQIKPQFEIIDEIRAFNQAKVLKSFINQGVSAAYMTESTGYGYDDRGRDILESVFAEITGAETALFRHNFMSGTHTLTVALFGILRPGDRMLIITGEPYDTLLGVIGTKRKANGSLGEFGITVEECALTESGELDYETIDIMLRENDYKAVYIQRSRGYTLRRSLTPEDIGKTAGFVKSRQPETIVIVDNCYGEFVSETEPTQHGADMIVGSLIKNPGGGIAPTGGYIAGRKSLIDLCAGRLTCPGVGGEIGATLGHSRALYMGLYSAPHVTGEALKSAVYAAALFASLGFSSTPLFNAPRADIIESIELKTPERLIAFCEGIQAASPVDSFAVPIPAPMPGYDSEVIMAAGAFIGGSSIELSADAPLREPYSVWLQGGLNFDSARIAVLSAATKISYEE